MAMSKEDYVKVAKILHDEWPEALKCCDFAASTVIAIRDKMADMFIADNPHFDLAKFNATCGIPEDY